MKIFTVKLKYWYFAFSAGVFLVLAMIAGIFPSPFAATALTGQRAPVFQGNLAEPKIALACNVFWGEDLIPDMLKILADKNVKITFFMGGSWSKRYPDIVRSIADAGHELGNHSYSHPHPNALTKQENQDQILRTEQLLTDITGKKTTLYAPPYGEYNDRVIAAAAELGYTTVMWSIDTIDWQRPSPEVIKNRVLKKIHNGAIILMHPTKPTLEALPGLLDELIRRGYQVTTVSIILPENDRQ